MDSLAVQWLDPLPLSTQVHFGKELRFYKLCGVANKNHNINKQVLHLDFCSLFLFCACVCACAPVLLIFLPTSSRGDHSINYIFSAISCHLFFSTGFLSSSCVNMLQISLILKVNFIINSKPANQKPSSNAECPSADAFLSSSQARSGKGCLHHCFCFVLFSNPMQTDTSVKYNKTN